VVISLASEPDAPLTGEDATSNTTCLGYEGKSETISLILCEGGVDFNAQTRTGDTALHILCRSGNTEVFQLLLDLGADAYVKNGRRKLPHQLARGETASIFRTLTESTEPKSRTSKKPVDTKPKGATTDQSITPSPPSPCARCPRLVACTPVRSGHVWLPLRAHGRMLLFLFLCWFSVPVPVLSTLQLHSFLRVRVCFAITATTQTRALS